MKVALIHVTEYTQWHRSYHISLRKVMRAVESIRLIWRQKEILSKRNQFPAKSHNLGQCYEWQEVIKYQRLSCFSHISHSKKVFLSGSDTPPSLKTLWASESETLRKKQFIPNPPFERLLLKPTQCLSGFERWIFHPRVSNCMVHNNEIWIKEFITGFKQRTACVQLPLRQAREIKIISSIWNARTDLWPSSWRSHRKLSTR